MSLKAARHKLSHVPCMSGSHGLLKIGRHVFAVSPDKNSRPSAHVIATELKNKRTFFRRSWSLTNKKVKVKWFRYRPVVAQRVDRGIALLFHDRGGRTGWAVSSTPRLHFTPGKGPVPILQEAGWAPGSVWTGGKSRTLRDSIPDRPTHSQSLRRLSYTTCLPPAALRSWRWAQWCPKHVELIVY